MANTPHAKAFLAPNSSDQELVARAKDRLDVQQLRTGDIYISYEPPDLIVRVVYEKKPSGMVKMKSVATIRL